MLRMRGRTVWQAELTKMNEEAVREKGDQAALITSLDP
jgi:hypothetical protein